MSCRRMDTVLVDTASGTAVTISRIRDADTSTWLALRQIELVLLPHVARQSLIYSLKKTGEPFDPRWASLPVERGLPCLVPAESRRSLPGQLVCICCIVEGHRSV